MMSLHEVLDSTQGILVVGAFIFFVYDKLKKPELLEIKTTELTNKIEDLDDKLTSAMTDMAREVKSLAVSVGKLEGRWEGHR